MSQPDPFLPPAADLHSERSDGGSRVDAEAYTLLRQSGPWVALIAGVGFVLAVVMFFNGLRQAFVSRNLDAESSGVSMSPVFLGIALFYGSLAFLLWRYGASLRRLQPGASPASLIEVARRHRVFWRAAAIGVLVMIALMLLVSVFLLFMPRHP
jgi:hypothetical protein